MLSQKAAKPLDRLGANAGGSPRSPWSLSVVAYRRAQDPADVLGLPLQLANENQYLGTRLRDPRNSTKQRHVRADEDAGCADVVIEV